MRTSLSLAISLLILTAAAGALAPREAGGEPFVARFERVRPDLYYLDGTLPPAWGDGDGDGDPDLSLSRNDRLARFAELPNVLDLLRPGNYHGVSWCDYDRDGFAEVVVLGYGMEPTRTRLLRRWGESSVEDVAPALGMDLEGYAETAVWGDFDADGWPDLFVPCYAHVPPGRSFLFQNDGRGGFRDVARPAGVAMANQPAALKPEGACAADWDGDGDLDLYCASHLFLNDGTGRFTDVRETVGLPARFDEGASFVDHDSDGDLDLYLKRSTGGQLFRNDGGRFADVTDSAGIPRSPGLMWGDNWADVDHDEDLDLVTFIRDSPAMLLLNRGDGTFEPDSQFTKLRLTEGFLAWADADLDGDLDFAAGALPTTVYLNQLDTQPGFADSWLRIRVLDAQGFATEHGASVRLARLDRGGKIQTRVVDGGSGYLTQNEYDVHFGVDPKGTYALSVSFPSRPDARVVVDSTAMPELGHLTPDSLASQTIVVRRDSSVVLERGVLGAPGTRDEARLCAAPIAVVGAGAVELALEIERETPVSIGIFDVLGRRVRALHEGSLRAGRHRITWDREDDGGRPVTAGIYFVRTASAAGRCVRRLAVLR